MTDSAYLKLNRAMKHVSELSELFRKHQPFTYILETNNVTGQRSTFAKRDQAIIDDAAVIAGDAVFNMRSALDHAYWEIVRPHLRSSDKPAEVQFPFQEKRKYFKASLRKRYANRVSFRFLLTLFRLSPYSDGGGNKALWLVHDLCNVDKHRLLIPTADYKTITGAMIRPFAPEFPLSDDSSVSMSGASRDIVWNTNPIHHAIRSAEELPEVVEQEISVPVDIILNVGPEGRPKPMIQTLYNMLDATRIAVEAMRAAVS